MKKLAALLLALVMVLALCACGSTDTAPAAEEAPAEEAAVEEAPAADASGEPAAAEVTWADYQAYLMETAGANAPDQDEFQAQIDALTCWEDIDQTVSPWDQMFSTLGLSTWDEFVANNGVGAELAVQSGSTDPNAGSSEASGEVAA